MKPQLVIFVKAPLMGKAKTRLAADIGFVHAQRIYKAMTARLLRNLVSDKWDTILAVTPGHWLGNIPIWDGLPQYKQVSGSLSPRLAQAFSAKGKTIVIGSDCPQVTRADINTAFKAIRPNVPVFGPAEDGGFWLIGALGPLAPSVFDNIRWSTENTLSDIKKRLPCASTSLRTLQDVDDLKALQEVQMSGQF